MHVDLKHLKQVQKILSRGIPNYEVWAFGSRVHGENLKPFSDLDLVIMTKKPIRPSLLGELKDALMESDLPFKVDVVDWASIAPGFRKAIRERYEVIQSKKGD